MTNGIVKSIAAYKCTVCDRSIRLPINPQGLTVINRCTITHGCLGVMQRLISAQEIKRTTSFPSELAGVRDWFPRKVLYTHNQPIQSTQWDVIHNLSNKPAVQVYADTIRDGKTVLVEMFPTKQEIITNNRIRLFFDVPASGVAQCISPSSEFVSNDSLQVDSSTPLQITTNSGEITIATTSNLPTLGVAVIYKVAGQNDDVLIEYAGIPIYPSVNSPWVGYKSILVNGIKYYIRSFNLTTTPLAPPYFNGGLIPNGSLFYFANVGGNPMKAGQNLLLLNKSPGAPIDKILDQYIDLADINQNTPQLFYTSNTAFASNSLTKTTYPLITFVD